MRRSKLESYEAILQAMVRKPLAIEHISYETGMECTRLKRHLNFLIENGLAEKRFRPRKTLYAITERGIAVFKTLNFSKYIERISNTLSTIDDAIQTVPALLKNSRELPNGKDEG